MAAEVGTAPSSAPARARPRFFPTWSAPASSGSVTARLLLGSATMLFLELALIRWLGANVVHLSYFSNFVLLGSFLGIGLGLPDQPQDLDGAAVHRATARRDRGPRAAVPGQHPALRCATSSTSPALHTTGPPAWLALPIIFLLVAAILAGPAEVVGRCFGAARAADGLPLRPDRLADRHRAVHAALVPLGPVAGLGRADRGRADRAHRRHAGAAARGRERRGDRRACCSPRR